MVGRFGKLYIRYAVDGYLDVMERKKRLLSADVMERKNGLLSADVMERKIGMLSAIKSNSSPIACPYIRFPKTRSQNKNIQKMATTVNMTTFWHVAPCSLVEVD
jgi:hypothetical protein